MTMTISQILENNLEAINQRFDNTFMMTINTLQYALEHEDDIVARYQTIMMAYAEVQDLELEYLEWFKSIPCGEYKEQFRFEQGLNMWKAFESYTLVNTIVEEMSKKLNN